jgi:hypothetical protein
MGGLGSGGRNKKSEKRKRLEGNAGKRKKRKNHPRSAERPADHAQPSGPLGPAPSHLKAQQKQVWDELSSIVPIGAVEASDRWAFELLVCLMAKFRRGAAKAGEVNQISSQLARFGMTPSDRDRVNRNVPPSPKSDPWAKFGIPARSQ